ncbi:MAG: transporter substrate-binding domain-containing protein [Rhodoferax sp.]|nr:transporter substrate-binding domain-containing protein [Rhodoferax sp.]
MDISLLRKMVGLLALWAAWGTSHAETLVVLGDHAYAPVIYSQNGKPAGLLPAILARASALTGDHYDLRLSPWKRAYELAARGEGGVVGVSLNQERARSFDFSRPLYDDDIQIITLKGKTFPYAKLEDLKGKTIGGINGASYGDDVDKAIASGMFVVDRDVGQAGRLRKLLAGRLDGAFIGNGQAGFDSVVSSEEELRNSRAQFVVLSTPLTRDPLHLAFPKSMHKREALDRFDAALEKLKQSGELKRLATISATAR